MLDKFKKTNSLEVSGIGQNDFVAFSFMVKNIQFNIPFKISETGYEVDIEGVKKKYKSFQLSSNTGFLY